MQLVVPKNDIQNFRKKVKEYYFSNKRPMPWRETTDSYAIMVSEIMLQQTQVDRVIPKFEAFMDAFPTVQDLAHAPFKNVLTHWSGLGYNRRALWLHEAAQSIVREYNSIVPDSIESLVKLKGIGHNTAAAICAYAFNQPVVYVETNIRAAFIHYFFPDREDVHDDEIFKIASEALDKNSPREWYWALMDYGTFIKKQHKNPARKSKHHTKQSKFEGSRRQVRGEILRYLLVHDSVSVQHITESIASHSHSVEDILQDMVAEGLVIQDKSTIALP